MASYLRIIFSCSVYITIKHSSADTVTKISNRRGNTEDNRSVKEII